METERQLLTVPGHSFVYSGSQRLTQLLNYNNGGQWKVSLTKGVTGEGWTLENNPVSGSSVNYMVVQNWNLDANGRAASRTGYAYSPYVSGSNENNLPCKMNVLHLTFEKPFATQHKRNGYNARGELATAWQQSETRTDCHAKCTDVDLIFAAYRLRTFHAAFPSFSVS